MFFDSHAHLDDPAFDRDRDLILNSLAGAGIGRVLIPGSSVESSRRALRFAQSDSRLFCAVGVHPEFAGEMRWEDLDLLSEIASENRCVAIGEIGLDYHYGPPEIRDAQRYWFYQQLQLAYSLNLPVIIHDREAHQDCFDAVRRFGVRGVFHCYSSSAEMAKELVKIGFYCSFTGVITYQGAKKAIRAIEELPLERILIETDSPYLAPVPLQKQRNDPRNVVAVAEKIAEIRKISIEDVMRITEENACRLFRIL